MKKKVAIIGVKGLPGYGGSARANDEILRRLSSDYDITVYALDTHASKSDYFGLKQHIFKSISYLKINSLVFYIKSLMHVLIRGDFDFVHLNHGVSGFILPILRIRYRAITSIRGLNYVNDDKWSNIEFKLLKLSEWLSFKLSDYIITVQKSSIDYIKKRTSKPVFYIPNGVENNYIYYKDIEKEKVITFSAARLIYLKGVHDFLEALNKLNFKGKIRIIGDLGHVPDYSKRIRSLADGLDVQFTGLIKDKVKLFTLIASSKLYVFPSYSEGMSNMLLEVASLKVPIIASDIRANKDVFEAEEVLYFPVGNTEVLAKKISFLWNNPDIGFEYSEKAYQKVLSIYNWDRVALKYSDLYNHMG